MIEVIQSVVRPPSWDMVEGVSATPAGLRRMPPGLGADTDEILGEAGLGSEEIAKLRENGTVL